MNAEAGVRRLRSFLARNRRIGVDTSIFIYQLEENAKYLFLTEPVFASLEQGETEAVTSTITMAELLVHPYRISALDRVSAMYALLSTYPNLYWTGPDLDIADSAAKLRALYRLRTPDALQAATAVHFGATGMLTNDPVFRRIDAFETLLVDDLL